MLFRVDIIVLFPCYLYYDCTNLTDRFVFLFFLTSVLCVFKHFVCFSVYGQNTLMPNHHTVFESHRGIRFDCSSIIWRAVTWCQCLMLHWLEWCWCGNSEHQVICHTREKPSPMCLLWCSDAEMQLELLDDIQTLTQVPQRVPVHCPKHTKHLQEGVSCDEETVAFRHWVLTKCASVRVTKLN